MKQTLTKPTPKHIAVVQQEIETLMKRPSVRTLTDGVLVSLHFSAPTKIPTGITEMREELEEVGFLLFYNNLSFKGSDVVSFNFTKIKG